MNFRWAPEDDERAEPSVHKFAKDRGIGMDACDRHNLLQRWAEESNMQMTQEALQDLAGSDKDGVQKMFRAKLEKQHGEVCLSGTASACHRVLLAVLSQETHPCEDCS